MKIKKKNKVALNTITIKQIHEFDHFQDVESYDPVLNPVLNRELRRTGGRVLITLGDQDIDLSPTFTIFLSTRDPLVNIYIVNAKR